jgi:teichuronic acid exporter
LSAEDSAEAPPGTKDLDEVMRGLRWIGTARLFTQFVTWSLTIFTVRLLEPRDYGIVATCGLFTTLAALLTDGGLSVVLISRSDLPNRTQGAAITGVVLVSLVLTGSIVAAAPLGAELFKTSALTEALRVSSIQLPLGALGVVPAALLARAFRFRELALAQAGPSVLQGLATVGMAWWGAGYWALILGVLVGGALRALVLWALLEKRPMPNLSFAALRSLWVSGGQMLGQRLVYFATQDFDTFMLGRLAGPTALGSYSLAKSLSHTALDQLAGIVNQVSMPAFAAKSGDERAQLNGLVLMISTASTLVFPFFWLACVLAHIALPLVFGNRWAAMVIPCMAFTFMLPLRSIYTLLDSAVAGTGRISTTLRNMLTWAGVMTPLLFVAAHFGASWAAASWCLGFPIVFIVSMARMARAFKVRLRTLLKPMRAPLLGSLVSAVVVALAVAYVKSYLPPAPQLVIGVLLGAACYALLMRQYARPDFDRTIHLGRRLFRF